MGNVQSSHGVVASVHYSPTYGVAIGAKHNNNNAAGRPSWVRQRKPGSPGDGASIRRKSPVTGNLRGQSQGDQGDVDNDIGQPFVGAEKWCLDARTAKSRTAISPSLIVNCSPQSVQEKRFQYSQSDSKGVSVSGSYGLDRDTDQNMLNAMHLQDSSVLLTPPDEDSLPYSRSMLHSDQNSVSEQSPLIDFSREQSPFSNSIRSYTGDSPSQAGSIRSSRLGEFDDSESDFGTTSPLPKLSNLDKSFKRNLLKRLSEWTSLSQELTKSGSNSGSGSLSPDVRSTPERRMKRSVTLGSTSSMSGIETESPVAALIEGNDIGLRTSKNLEDIEDEIHQIFSEFDYLNSKLTDLKSRNNGKGKIEPMVPDDPEIMAEAVDDEMIQVEIKEAYDHWCRQANERRGSRPTSAAAMVDSSLRLSSRGASFMERDLSWDATDIVGGTDTSVFGKGPSRSIPSVWSSKDGDSVDVVNRLSNMGEELDDRVWRQIEESTTRSEADQRKGSISPDDTSMTYDADTSNMEGNDTSLDVSDGSACTVVPVNSVGERVEVMTYAAREWKGNTPKSQSIREGYGEVVTRTGCSHMRQIRGDNYCAIRAALFQIFSKGLTLNIARQEILSKLEKMVANNAGGIKTWNFANRLNVENNLLEKMTCCIETFLRKADEARLLTSDEQRESWAMSVFNSRQDSDILLMEGVKLLMFIEAVDLYRDSLEGNQVPTFVWLLYARDTSENPHKFLTNHMNTIGDTGGLEQIEMCLLSHTLGVTIQVFRLADYGKTDFEATFSGDDSKLPTISLLAEDDRHYNVLVC